LKYPLLDSNYQPQRQVSQYFNVYVATDITLIKPYIPQSSNEVCQKSSFPIAESRSQFEDHHVNYLKPG